MCWQKASKTKAILIIAGRFSNMVFFKVFFLRAKEEKGATMVESAIAIPVFLLVLICTFDLFRICYNQLTIQHVMTRVMRQATAVYFQEMAAGDQINKITEDISRSLNSLGVGFDASSGDKLNLCPVSAYPCDGVTLGAPYELMILSVEKGIQGVFLPRYVLASEVLFRNEPI